MVLENKLGITDSVELAKQEERLSKTRALDLFDDEGLTAIPVGTFESLVYIHNHLFEQIYKFAGQIRDQNIAKGTTRFAPVMYLQVSLDNIDRMPQANFEQIIEKYVEMNMAHPFREGNGRSMRIWLDLILKAEIGMVVDWSQVDKEDYLLAMERSPIRDIEIKHIIKAALTSKTADRETYMKGINHSYYYEGYILYNVHDL